LTLTLLLHHPRLDDIYQTLDLLLRVPRMQTDPNSLAALWYSRRYDPAHYKSFALAVRSELFRCGCEE
jgi:hypothetical protein